MSSQRQLILDYLYQTLLPSITTGHGYVNTVAFVARGQRDLNDLTDDKFPCVFLAGTDEGRKNITNTQFQAMLEVNIIGAVRSQTGISGAQAILDTLIADVTKALYADQRQTGLVTNTEVRRIVTDDGDMDPHAMCSIQAIFMYEKEGATP